MKRIIAAASIVLVLAGCGVVVANKNSSALLSLNAGDTKEQLIALMGQPKSREVYGKNEYWFYKTGVSGDDRLAYTPVLLNDGRVVGWGNNYYKDIRNSESVSPAPVGGGGGGVLMIPNPAPIRPYSEPPMAIPRQPAFLPNQPQLPIQNPSITCSPSAFGSVTCR